MVGSSMSGGEDGHRGRPVDRSANRTGPSVDRSICRSDEQGTDGKTERGWNGSATVT